MALLALFLSMIDLELELEEDTQVGREESERS